MEAMALCYEALGEAAQAEECLHDALAIVGGQVAPNELSVRSRLAILSALGGRSAEAQAHLETCRDLMSPDQDWRGRTGVVAAAAAIVSTAAGDLEGAYARFEEATSVFRRYHLRVFEADALHRWGRALRAVGHESTADEKFDAAVVLYRQLEAHDRVLELVNSHRRSA
jgi:tetratricopeptide (TPR) repeat protein